MVALRSWALTPMTRMKSVRNETSGGGGDGDAKISTTPTIRIAGTEMTRLRMQTGVKLSLERSAG